MMSLSSTVWRRMLCTSTIGDSPVTVIVSSSEPTRSSASTVAVNVPVSVDAFAPDRAEAGQRERRRCTVPARRSTMRYRPRAVGHGRADLLDQRRGWTPRRSRRAARAPDESFTMPVIDACASATDGTQREQGERRDARPSVCAYSAPLTPRGVPGSRFAAVGEVRRDCRSQVVGGTCGKNPSNRRAGRRLTERAQTGGRFHRRHACSADDRTHLRSFLARRRGVARLLRDGVEVQLRPQALQALRGPARSIAGGRSATSR